MKRGLLVLGLAVTAGACGDDGNPQLNTGQNTDDRPGTILLSTENVTLEEGKTTSFDVTLSDDPIGGDAVIEVENADSSRLTVTETLNFGEKGTKSIEISSADDDVVGGGGIIKLTVRASGASNYAGAIGQSVLVTLRDNEISNGIKEPQLLNLREGQSKPFTLALEGKPSADVTVTLKPTDDEDLGVEPTSLTFTPDNYTEPQMATVTALVDDVDEFEEVQGIALLADGGGYTNQDISPLNVVISGEGGGGGAATVDPQAVMTSEDGTTATFDVTFDEVPAEGVTVTATSSSMTEGTVSGPVTLEQGNLVASFTVTGVDDDVVDGAQTYEISLATTSDNADFDGLSIPSVAVTNADNDGVSVSVSPTMVTLEENPPGMATVTVSLSSDPGETVTIMQTGPAGRVMVQPNALTFTSGNFGTPQTFTLTAIDNAMVTGDQMETLMLSISATGAYAGVEVDDVMMTLVDDDD